jgi:hypothetical protein
MVAQQLDLQNVPNSIQYMFEVYTKKPNETITNKIFIEYQLGIDIKI